MNDLDPILADDELRWLDVLLEEEVLAAANTPRALGVPRQWLRVIAALLGIAVLIATSWLVARPHEPAPAQAPQDPAPQLREIPFDIALSPRLTSVRVRYASVPEESGIGYQDPNVVRSEVRDAKAVADWRNALASCVPGDGGPVRGPYALDLGLGDGTTMVAFVDINGALSSGRDFAPNQRLRALLKSELEAIALRRRQTLGLARSLSELRSLPASSRRVTCPSLTADDARRELARFPQLETVEFDDSSANHPRRFGEADLPSTDLVLGLAGAPLLRSVTIHSRFLRADALRTLAMLPQLRSLSIFGDPKPLPVRELGEIAARVETLRLLDGEPTAEQLQAIAASKQLSEFWFQCGPDFAPAAECLRNMPRLRRLSLQAYGSLHENEAIAAIAHTHVAELRLANMNLTGPDLAPLAGLASLQTLHLEGVRMPSGCTNFPLLQQLRHLRIEGDSRFLAEVRESVPRAVVHSTDRRDDWVSPFESVRR